MYVFVYGTLKMGFGNSSLLNTSKYIHDDKLTGYKMLNLGPFPGIIKGDGTIHGEVYDIDSETLIRLDGLEGVPYLYNRCRVILESGLTAFVYYLTNPDKPNLGIIESGVWK